MNMARIGPRMQQALRVVAQNPGCSMLYVAAAVGPRGSLHFGYRTVHRAIDAGIIETRRGKGSRKWDLFTPELDLVLTDMDHVEGPLPELACEEHEDCLANTALAMACARASAG